MTILGKDKEGGREGREKGGKGRGGVGKGGEEREPSC
jgi:hypothetical protein